MTITLNMVGTKSMSNVIKVKKKGLSIMFPELTSKIVISYANPVTSKRGVPYVAVGFKNSNGYEQNFWFPAEFQQFASDHIGKEVTATFRFFSSRERTTLTGVALS